MRRCSFSSAVSLRSSESIFCCYICWELIGLCSFSLVGFWYQQKEAVSGARKVLLMTHLAGYGLLSAILILYHRTGTAVWTDPSIGGSFSTGVFLLMLIALVAKSVQVPLHTLDAGCHGCAYPGKLSASRRLLCDCRCLFSRAHAQLRRMAALVELHTGINCLSNHDGGRDVRPCAK